MITTQTVADQALALVSGQPGPNTGGFRGMEMIPLCQEKPIICWKRSRYIHSIDSDFGRLLCGEHHKKVKLNGRSWAGGCNENCSHLILTPPPLIYACCEDYRTIIQCNDCREFFCLEHWVDHWHDFLYEVTV